MRQTEVMHRLSAARPRSPVGMRVITVFRIRSYQIAHVFARPNLQADAMEDLNRSESLDQLFSFGAFRFGSLSSF